MLSPPYALWSIWEQLSLLQHAFVLILGTLCVYTVFSATSILFRLRSGKDPGFDLDPASTKYSEDALHNRCTNLRYMIAAAFYLFGVVLFLSFQMMGRYIMGDAFVTQFLGLLVLNCAFATNLFAVFLVLHLIQWLVASRLNRYSKRLPR